MQAHRYRLNAGRAEITARLAPIHATRPRGSLTMWFTDEVIATWAMLELGRPSYVRMA
jgi:hypothetical protein